MKVVHVLRKPLAEGTVAANVLQHAAGGINIDKARVAAPGEEITTHTQKTGEDGYASNAVYGDYEGGFTTHQTEGQKLGRWPGNLILQHLPRCRCEGTRKVKGDKRGATGGKKECGLEGKGEDVYKAGWRANTDITGTAYGDASGNETVANWTCVEGCPVAALDNQSGILKSGAMDSIATGGQYTTYGKMYERRVTNPASEGGASRYFKQIRGGG